MQAEIITVSYPLFSSPLSLVHLSHKKHIFGAWTSRHMWDANLNKSWIFSLIYNTVCVCVCVFCVELSSVKSFINKRTYSFSFAPLRHSTLRGGGRSGASMDQSNVNRVERFSASAASYLLKIIAVACLLKETDYVTKMLACTTVKKQTTSFFKTACWSGACVHFLLQKKH